jgi:acyl-CoA thioesterase-1
MKFMARRRFLLFVWLAAALVVGGCKMDANVTTGQGAVITPRPAVTPTAARGERPLIVAFGDSLTAGYGLPVSQAYTTLLQQKIDAAGLSYRVVNAGVSGDTSAGGVRRLAWALEGNVKVLILELGGNDALRGLPVAELRKNLTQMIEAARQRGVTVLLAGMEAPPNLGGAYTTAFRQVYRDLARQYKLPFIPFVLEGVGGVRSLNQPDGIHPNAEGEKRMTETVWLALKPLLTK